MSFNRPDYLHSVLGSLRAQDVPFRGDEVFLFQDGVVSSDGSHLSEPHLVDECEKVFEEFFPDGHVFRSEKNLGVARNFNRAEVEFFDVRKAQAAYFFEDDLVLGKNYLNVMQLLVNFAMNEEKVAYVAAYGDHRANSEQQLKAADQIVEMRHKWGFALTRRQWLAQRPIIDEYLRLTDDADYYKRDHATVRQYYKRLGFASPGTSQDSMKDVASAVLGTTKIMTKACFGRYIGETGLHSTKVIFEKEGFARTELFDGPLPNFTFPDQKTIALWIEHQRNFARAQLG